jgi:hypothetical protein
MDKRKQGYALAAWYLLSMVFSIFLGAHLGGGVWFLSVLLLFALGGWLFTD